MLLVVAQLVLPAIATSGLHDRLARNGQVLHVEVHAFPAIELLWHQADRVVVRMGGYRSASTNIGATLQQSADSGSVDATASVFQSGLLTVHDARLQKRGEELTATGRISESDLRAALPVLQGVTLLASGQGQLTLRGTASLFGVSVSVNATVAAQNGDLVVHPDVPFGTLATITVFSNPRVRVQDISAVAQPDGFSVTAKALLR